MKYIISILALIMSFISVASSTSPTNKHDFLENDALTSTNNSKEEDKEEIQEEEAQEIQEEEFRDVDSDAETSIDGSSINRRID